MGTMVATDVTGGVDVSVTLVNAVYFASTGRGHVTIAWNLDTPTAATSISPTTPTYTAVTSTEPAWLPRPAAEAWAWVALSCVSVV